MQLVSNLTEIALPSQFRFPLSIYFASYREPLAFRWEASGPVRAESFWSKSSKTYASHASSIPEWINGITRWLGEHVGQWTQLILRSLDDPNLSPGQGFLYFTKAGKLTLRLTCRYNVIRIVCYDLAGTPLIIKGSDRFFKLPPAPTPLSEHDDRDVLFAGPHSAERIIPMTDIWWLTYPRFELKDEITDMALSDKMAGNYPPATLQPRSNDVVKLKLQAWTWDWLRKNQAFFKSLESSNTRIYPGTRLQRLYGRLAFRYPKSVEASIFWESTEPNDLVTHFPWRCD